MHRDFGRRSREFNGACGEAAASDSPKFTKFAEIWPASVASGLVTPSLRPAAMPARRSRSPPSAAPHKPNGGRRFGPQRGARGGAVGGHRWSLTQQPEIAITPEKRPQARLSPGRPRRYSVFAARAVRKKARAGGDACAQFAKPRSPAYGNIYAVHCQVK